MADEAHARVRELLAKAAALAAEFRLAEPMVKTMPLWHAEREAWAAWSHWFRNAPSVEIESYRTEPDYVADVEGEFNARRRSAAVVNGAAKLIAERVKRYLDEGARLDGLPDTVALRMWVNLSLLDQPREEMVRSIASAVRAHIRSWKKRDAWSNEEKAKGMVRAALKAIGYTKDPFVADRVAKTRAMRLVKAKRTPKP